MAKRPAVPGSNKPNEHKHASWKHVFATGRQRFYFAFFIFWLVVNIALLGLVSQQIHAHGHQMSDWPTGKYQHAMGLLLFTTIFSTIIGVFHAWLNLPILMFLFFATAVMFATGAGIIYETPFGHGLQCSNSLDIIPVNWHSDFHWCRRVTAIEGLSWAMFGLAIIGLFYAFFDRFNLVAKRAAIYDDPEVAHEKIPETH